MSRKAFVVVQVLLLAAVALPVGALAQSKTFRVRADGGSRIAFVSDAPLEAINGVTSAVTGEVAGDPTAVAGVRGRVQVEIAKLRTGNETRDEHLRSDNWLDAARHPHATFEITRVEGAAALRPNQATQVRVRGRFTLHGVTKQIVAPATVRWVPLTDEMRQIPGMSGDVVMVESTFTVRLTDYNVSVPAIIRLKVANEVQVQVNLRAIAG